MTLSPSEIFKLAMTGKQIFVQPYMSVKKSQHDGRLKVQFIFDQLKETQVIRSITVTNPLAMVQAIQTLNVELQALIAHREQKREKIKAQKEAERKARQEAELAQRQTEVAKSYLQEARSMVQQINERKKLEMQQQLLHSQRFVIAARKPIQAILQRVAPVIDPWAYRNVYGKPAEVFIF